MRFPQINKQALRGIRVPDLAGGINTRDSLNMINDNQLIESRNMWYKDGVLKTRPGLYTNESLIRFISGRHVGAEWSTAVQRRTVSKIPSIPSLSKDGTRSPKQRKAFTRTYICRKN